jgi:hypothetical protein
MFHYLLEDGVNSDDWMLRRKVLELHDATLRLRLFKSIGATEQYKRGKEIVRDLRADISNLAAFKNIPEDRQAKLLSGQELYVGGLRSTLKLASVASVKSEYFDGMYAYLSSQVHVSPTSFFKSDERLSFGPPAEYQYYFASYAVGHARMMLLRSAIKLANSDAVIFTKIEPTTLSAMNEMVELGWPAEEHQPGET